MMQISEDSRLRGFRVFTEDQLEEIAGRGWQLVAVIQEKSLVTRQQEVKCGGISGDGGYCRHGNSKGYCSTSDYVDVPGELVTTKYLMGRDKDDVMTEMAENLKATESRRAEAEHRESRALSTIKEAKKAVEEKDNLVAEAKAHVADLSKKHTELKVELRDRQKRIETMETHMGKVENEFGAQAIRRVLLSDK